MLCAVCPSPFKADAAYAESVTLSLGKVCISPQELAENGYTVTIPVRVYGAYDGILSFDSTYIAFGDIDLGDNPLDIGNVCAQDAKLSISQQDISSENFNITSSFGFVENGIDAFSISGYCSYNRSGDEITLCELSFTLPQTAQLGDIYNIAWYDALNSALKPAISSQNGDYEIEHSDGLVYIGSLGVTNYSQYESAYLADDTEAVGTDVALAINPDVQGHSAVDISDLVSFGFDGCQTMDTTYAQSGDASVSPFDLYWGAYQTGGKLLDFSGNLTIDKTCLDSLCERIGAAIGIELDPVADFSFFEGTLLDENGELIALGDFDFCISQRGDANLDHSVDAKDAALVAKYSSQLAVLPPGADLPDISSTNNELAKLSADTNGDGAIDAKDAANTAKFSSENSISSFDAPKTYYTIWSSILN